MFMTTQLDKIAKKANENRKLCFTAVAHTLTPEFLVETWRKLNRKGKPGIDGETTKEYEIDLRRRVEELVDRLKRKAYQAPPVRRVHIPKDNGKTRPLGIPTVEDRLVQAAVARILNALYEPLFLDCSFGFRPKRSAHQAIECVRNTIMAGGVLYVHEADIRAFFDKVNHEWLRKMLKIRIKDPVILRLIDKWLRAGVMDGGLFQQSEEGVPQGGPISPILSNIYLHYALDLWFEKKVKPRCEGPAYLIRYADDWIACFGHTYDMNWFEWNLGARLQKFHIELAPEKTKRLIFGRHAKRYLKGKLPEFTFLGFRHIQSTARNGNFTVQRLPDNRRIGRFRQRLKSWLHQHWHWKPREQQRYLSKALVGFYQYYGLRCSLRKLRAMLRSILTIWRYALGRRGQRRKMYWSVLETKEWFRLPEPRVYHPSC
jgi:RNA-directed DNA polymerase